MSTNGSFSVSPFFRSLIERPRAASLGAVCGVLRPPTRVLAFVWTTLLGKILTIDNFRRYGILLVNACPLCLKDEESIDLDP